MSSKPSKTFRAAAAKDTDRILGTIRTPEYLTGFYVTHRSKDVARALLHLARNGEEDTVTSFLSGDAKRFETLAEKGHLKTLMDVLECLDKKQQFKVLTAVETQNYGEPNAAALSAILNPKKNKISTRLVSILQSFNTEQRTGILAAPRGLWYMSGSGHLGLLEDMVESLSKPQRQRILTKGADAALGIVFSGDKRLERMFKGCKYPKGGPQPGGV